MAHRRSFNKTPPFYLHVKRTYVEEIDLIPTNHSWKHEEKPGNNPSKNNEYNERTYRAPSTVPELDLRGSMNVDTMASNVDENTRNQLVPSTARSSIPDRPRLSTLDLNLGTPAGMLNDPPFRRQPPFQFQNREFKLQVLAAANSTQRLALMPPPLSKPKGKTLQVSSSPAKVLRNDVPNFKQHEIPQLPPLKVLKVASAGEVNTPQPRVKYPAPLKNEVVNCLEPLNKKVPNLEFPRTELKKVPKLILCSLAAINKFELQDAVIAKVRVQRNKSSEPQLKSSTDLTEGLVPVGISLQDSTKSFNEPSSVESTSKKKPRVNADQNVPQAELIPDSTPLVAEKVENLQKCAAAVVPDLQPATTSGVSLDMAAEVEQRVPDLTVVYPPMIFECEKDFYNAKTSLKRQIKEFEAQQQKLQLRLGLSKRQKVPQLHKNFN